MQRGYTLIGLLIAMALLATLASLAAPSFSDLRQTAVLDAQRQHVMDALWYTRSEAVSRRVRVTMQARESGWSDGWKIFIDHNQNGHHDPSESLLQQRAALPEGFQLLANRGIGHAASYRSDGRSTQPDGGLQMGTFTLCRLTANTGNIMRQAIVMSATGRVRIKEDVDQTDDGSC